MADLSLTIAPKSDQLNADDLITGPRTIRIARVWGNEGSAEQPINISYEGDGGKPYRPCKSMRRVMVQVWGKDGASYAGRRMTLYRDPEVQFGGLKVGGIRISHMSDIAEPVTMALTASRTARKAYKVMPLAAQVDKVAEGVRALLERIGAGEDIAADPTIAKQRAWLTKNRPELAAEIDAALAARDGDEDPFEGPSDTQRGETTTLESALAEIRAAAPGDVDARTKALLPLLGEDDGATLRAAAIERMNGGVE